MKLYCLFLGMAAAVLVAVLALSIGGDAATWVVDDDGTPGVDCDYTHI